MPTTNGNRKILDLKRWEMVAPLQAATSAGAFIASSRHYRQQQLYVASNTSAWLYNPSEDGWTPLASPALAGTFGAGACGVAGAVSIGSSTGAAQLTATGGTTTTIQTNQNLQRDLRGYSVHITGGPNAGATLAIVSNTLGASATITVAAQATAFSASTTYRLITPVWYVLGAGTTAAGSFRKYDFATNTWTTLAQAGLPATISTDSKLVSTPSWIGENFLQFLTGTASAGAAATLTHTGKSWTTNQWTNYQIRIVSGTGAGQIRNIASNTGSVITVSANWTTNPDATSVYSIEGNDDYLYYLGSGAVGIIRYSISANTWTTLSPTVARAAAPGAGMSAHWVHSATDAAWTGENDIRNGRRIYSFRGGNTSLLDYYDIAANTWVNGVPYAPAGESHGTGTKWIYSGDFLYGQHLATGRWFRVNLVTSAQDGWSVMVYPQGAAVVGDTAFDATFIDGATRIDFLYIGLNTSTVMLRQMVI
jgi:hypothetical protein